MAWRFPNSTDRVSTFVELLRSRAHQYPEQRAFTFLADGEAEKLHLTYGELDAQARRIAALLQSVGRPGNRVLLLFPSGLDLIAAFFGSLYAGLFAAPLNPPHPTRLEQTLPKVSAVATDCRPIAVLTTSSLKPKLEKIFGQSRALNSLRCLSTDQADEYAESDWKEPSLDESSIAYLQYTSGSTCAPRGVVVTHDNLMQNHLMLYEALQTEGSQPYVSWLPLSHDMGLVGCVLAPIYLGSLSVIMPPATFLQSPLKWLKAITRYRAAYSGGPNFAYDLCAQKLSAADKQTLDLSCWKRAFNGADTVRGETLERFTTAFAASGFSRTAFFPCYGLAEATLFVAGAEVGPTLALRSFKKSSLEQNRVAPTSSSEPDSRTLVGCGRSWGDQRIVIVNSESLVPCSPDEIGEIWVSGRNVTKGYWNKPEETKQTFQAYLTETNEGPFLRTGDLGFITDGELFVTGRLKDLIIVRGRNLYPQDIERTAEQCHPSLRPGCGAAFAIDDGHEERLVVVQEVNRNYRKESAEEILRSIRRAVVEQHETEVAAIKLLPTGSIPKTTSGKVRRHVCRQTFLDETLPAVCEWTLKQELARVFSASPAKTELRPENYTFELIQEWLVSHLSAKLNVTRAPVNPHDSLSTYALDSADVVMMAGDLEEWIGFKLSPTLLYEHSTIETLARYLAETSASLRTSRLETSQRESAMSDSPGKTAHPSQKKALLARQVRSRIAASSPPKIAPVAIVGMGCRFPQADGPEAFWQMLRSGVDAIREVPTERWNVALVYDPNPQTPGKMYTRWGSFLDDVDKFEPQFFGISPREAISLDPQQRLLLEVSWEALEDAGQAPDKLVGSRTGVFMGVSPEEYSTLQDQTDPATIDVYTGTGLALSVAVGRIAYVLGLHGPTMTVDTACSSSLVAVHLAVQSLRNRECGMALAGGVNMILSPRTTIYFSQVRAMAADGRCKSFDASADGYVRGEGCGVVVLKLLSEALAHGDNILAVIRGSAVNHDGHSSGLTVPSGPAQQEVIRQALLNAGIKPAQVSYVETHGTGTPLGDPIEVRALAAGLSQGRPPDQQVAIGSVKTNIGHLESAAGIAGLMKVVLAMRHQEIPPHLHFKEWNPHLSSDKLPVWIPTTLTPWMPSEGKRIAGVSSFGISGTNAHVIMEEAPASEVPARDEARDERSFLLPLSAKSPEALVLLAKAYHQFLTDKAHDSIHLRDICYTASTRRGRYDYRLAVVGHSRAEVAAQLEGFSKGEEGPATFSGRRVPGRKRKLAFVFPGQGSQWAGMGRELLANEPVFREAIEQCDKAMRDHADWSLLEMFTSAEAQTQLDEIDRIQPTIFAIQVGIAAVLHSWGIEPAAVTGQSMGEVAAAYVAGALNLDDAARIICRRSRLLKRTSGLGAMVAIELSLEQAQDLLQGYEDRVSIAINNSPRATVLSGDRSTLEEIIRTLEGKEVFCRWVKVDVASHSPQMDCLREDLLRELRDVQGRNPRTTFYSTVDGCAVNGNPLDANYWVRNLREPVLFNTVVQQLVGSQHDIFVEISPHPVLLPAIDQGLRFLGKDGTVISSLRRDAIERDSLLGVVASLYAAGQTIDWSKLYREPGRVVQLPTYKWNRERYWLETQHLGAGFPQRRLMTNGNHGHPLVSGHWTSSIQMGDHFWEMELNTKIFPYLKDHSIGGMAVLPAAAYVEMALAAATEAFGPGSHTLQQIEFKKLLLLPESSTERLQLALTVEMGNIVSFRLSGQQLANGQASPWVTYATGMIRLEKGGATVSVPQNFLPAEIQARCQQAVSHEQHYEAMRRLGLEYGPTFQGVQEVWIQDEEAIARLQLPEGAAAQAERYHVHPALLDASFQLLGSLMLSKATANLSDGDGYLPVAIGEARVLEGTSQARWGYARLDASAELNADVFLADVFLLDEDGKVVTEVLGFRAQRIDQDDRAKQQNVSDMLYEIQWQAQLLTPSQIPSEVLPSESPGSWLIFADSGGVGQQLSAMLESQHHLPIIVSPGDSYQQLSEHNFQVNPSEPEDFHRLFREIAADTQTQCRAIVHLWSLDDAEEVTLSGLQRAQQLGCASVLHLVQALARVSWQAAPRVWLVTAGAQAVGGPLKKVAIAQAPVWGLGRTITHEHPELHCTRVDLSFGAGSRDEVQALYQEVSRPGSEDQIALRGSERYVARLAQCGFAAEASSVADANGDQPKALRPAADTPFRMEITTPGILDNLTLRPLARKAPARDDVEVEVEAAGVNFSDVMKALGIYPGTPDRTIVIGGECSGRISAIGEGVTEFHIGDEVVAIAPHCFSSFVTSHRAYVSRKPVEHTFAEAATIPVAFLTAHYSLNHLGRLRKGERVLIHSASGGVGLAAVQLAQHAGAEIFATAGTPEKREFLKSLGIQHVMDSRSLKFAGEVLEATSNEGVDIILNSLAGEAIPRGLEILRPFGRFVEIGKRDIYLNSRLRLEPFQKNLSFFAVDLDQALREDPHLMISLLRELQQSFEIGALKPLPHRIFPISEGIDAMRFMAQSKHIGKVVLSLKDEQALVEHQAEDKSPFKEGTYLITGGLGAIGLTLAEWLVSQGARSLVLLGRKGRTTIPAATDERLDTLGQLGANVYVAQADVAEEGQLAKVLADVRESMPPIKGIIHAAGILDDGILLRLDAQRFKTVMSAKTEGAWNLHALTLNDPLDFFVLFSSAAAMFGSPGQGNYAAANAFLDGLAHYRHAGGLPALSINWGPWSEGGLATEHDKTGRLAVQGFESIAPQQGIEALSRLLKQKFTQVAVIPINFQQWKRSFPAALESPLLSDVVQQLDNSGRVKRQESLIRKELLSIQAGWSRRAFLESYLQEQVAQVLKLSKSQVDPQTPLHTLGFDSLMALDLRNRLEAGLGLTLSATMAWNYPTITELAPHLAAKMGVPLDHQETEEAREIVGAEAEAEEDSEDLIRLLGAVKEISEDELHHMVVDAAALESSANE